MNAIEIINISKDFKERRAVDSLSLSIREGEIFSLLGMNGAGKTTAIKICTGLLKATAGDVKIFGLSIAKNPTDAKQLLNISPQETAVAQKLTVAENLEFAARIYGYEKKESIEKCAHILERFSLQDRAKDMAGKLSGGLQRRLSIAMAMITEPKIVFLDEPTLGLDIVARRSLWQFIEGLRNKTTVILTTHYLEEAEALSDRIAIMKKGQLMGLGTVDELKKQTDKESFENAFLALAGEDKIL